MHHTRFPYKTELTQAGVGFSQQCACASDPELHIPHFEKMLYDNPQLASTYLDAFACSRAPLGTPQGGSQGDEGQLAETGGVVQQGGSQGGPKGVPRGGLQGGGQLAETARGVLDYLLRDMRHPSGAFFSAEVCGKR